MTDPKSNFGYIWAPVPFFFYNHANISKLSLDKSLSVYICPVTLNKQWYRIFETFWSQPMESLQLKTCLSPKVHFLIVEAGRSRKKMEEGVSCLTSEGFIHWEQARCYLSGILINMYMLHGSTVRFVDLCIYIHSSNLVLIELFYLLNVPIFYPAITT